MGLIMQPETEVQKAEPAYGKTQVEYLRESIAWARAATNGNVEHTLLNSINERYRGKAYRDHIKASLSQGHVNQNQIDEMRSMLAGIRYCRRTPHAKGYRYQWP